MKCLICKQGDVEPGLTTVTLQRGETVVVIKDVPGQICQDCGEYYLDADVTTTVYGQAEQAVQRRTQVEIVRYAA